MVLNYKIDNLFKDLDVLDNYPASDSMYGHWTYNKWLTNE